MKDECLSLQAAMTDSHLIGAFAFINALYRIAHNK